MTCAVVEPIYAHRSSSDRLMTSPDQYDVSGKFGNFSPRFTIKCRREEKPVVCDVDYVGRLEPYIMPRSPRYTIGCRFEPMFDPTGNNGPSYIPPAFGSQGRKATIGRRFTDPIEQAMSKARVKPVPRRVCERTISLQKEEPIVTRPPITIPDLPPMPRFNEGRKIIPGEELRPNFAAVKPRVPVHEPQTEVPPETLRGASSARTGRLRNRPWNPNENLTQCGPTGRPEFRYIRSNAQGPAFTIGNRDESELVR